jgi:peroxiredoxin
MDRLNDKIRQTIKHLRDVLPTETTSLLEQGAGEISALDIIENALRPGNAAPDFQLSSYDGKTRRLADYLEKGPLVLTFYRGVWCPYCNLQMKDYDNRLGEITDLGASLVAVTPEKPGALDTLKATGAPEEAYAGAVTSVGFDVLHDTGNQLARHYGLVFDLPESHRTALSQFGVDIEALTGEPGYAFPDPATYVVAQDGTIAWAFVPNNYRKRAEVDDIAAALRTLQSSH